MLNEEDMLFLELEVAARKEFEANLPEGWVQSHSKKHGRMYYFNTITGESRWIHPLIPEDENQVSWKQLLEIASGDYVVNI